MPVRRVLGPRQPSNEVVQSVALVRFVEVERPSDCSPHPRRDYRVRQRRGCFSPFFFDAMFYASAERWRPSQQTEIQMPRILQAWSLTRAKTDAPMM